MTGNTESHNLYMRMTWASRHKTQWPVQVDHYMATHRLDNGQRQYGTIFCSYKETITILVHRSAGFKEYNTLRLYERVSVYTHSACS